MPDQQEGCGENGGGGAGPLPVDAERPQAEDDGCDRCRDGSVCQELPAVPDGEERPERHGHGSHDQPPPYPQVEGDAEARSEVRILYFNNLEHAGSDVERDPQGGDAYEGQPGEVELESLLEHVAGGQED